MSLHALAEGCWSQMAATTGGGPPLVARVDTMDGLRLIAGRPYAFVSSHLPFGAHEQLTGQADLLTLLRDPLGRVRSAYTYDSMRAERPVSAAGFAAFMAAENNRNVMTKLLAGHSADTTIDHDALDIAKDNLRRFSLCGASDGTKTVFEDYLRRWHLPNVISGRINQTQSAYQIDARPFAAELLARNALDAELFAFFRARAAENHPAPLAASLHPMTVLIVERPALNAAIANSVAVPTPFLQDIGLITAAGTLDQAVLTDFAHALRQQHIIG